MKGWTYNEENVSAQKEAEKYGARLQKAHEHEERQTGAEEKKTKGKKEADCVIFSSTTRSIEIVWSQAVRERVFVAYVPIWRFV